MQISSKAAGWVVCLLLAVYYILNRYPGLAFIDSGELALCSYSLGVPHPTGYPLYVILTAPAAQLFSRPITGVTLFAGVLTALGGWIFFHLLVAVRQLGFRRRGGSNLIAALATLILFLSPVVAAQGTTNEVYALALLANLTAVWAAVRAFINDDPAMKSRYLILTWYLAGLSLCNHMSSIQLLPGLVIVTFFALRRFISPRLLMTSALAFIIPLTIYAVLPIRAAATPPPITNWGDVTTWDNFIRHVSGWQFQVWMFKGEIFEIWANFKNFIGIVYNQFPFVILPFILMGIYALYRRAALLLVFLLLIMAVNIGLGINYGIPDIDSYYLLTIAIIMLLAVLGLFHLGNLIKARNVVPVITALLLVWQVVAVWNDNYKGDYTLPEDFAYNIGRSADNRAIIMSEIWDHHGQVFYLQQAEGFRPDVKLIDKELLRRSWYYKTIKGAYPELYEKIADLVPPFLEEIRIFESKGDFDAAKLEFYYQAIINRLLIECGPAYIDYRLKYTPRGDHYLRPQGILFRVDTIAIQSVLPQPALVWRGRPFGEYDDWRALHHVDILKKLGVY